MSDLGWRADGIERSIAAGGVVLERYRRPGFMGGHAVRRSEAGGLSVSGAVEFDPDPYQSEEGRAPRRKALPQG